MKSNLGIPRTGSREKMCVWMRTEALCFVVLALTTLLAGCDVIPAPGAGAEGQSQSPPPEGQEQQGPAAEGQDQQALPTGEQEHEAPATGNQEQQAPLEEYTLMMIYNGSGNDMSVHPPGELTDSGRRYVEGVEVSVTAIAEPCYGFVFDHWEGDASGTDNPFTLVMDGDKTVEAVFMLVIWVGYDPVHGVSVRFPQEPDDGATHSQGLRLEYDDRSGRISEAYGVWTMPSGNFYCLGACIYDGARRDGLRFEYPDNGWLPARLSGSATAIIAGVSYKVELCIDTGIYQD